MNHWKLYLEVKMILVLVSRICNYFTGSISSTPCVLSLGRTGKQSYLMNCGLNTLWKSKFLLKKWCILQLYCFVYGVGGGEGKKSEANRID